MSAVAPLRGIVGNRGDHASYKDIMHALEGPHGEPMVDFAMLVEMHSEQETMDRIGAKPHWIVVRGPQRSDCLILNAQTINFIEGNIIDLLPAGRRPPRVGKYNMEKDAVGAVVRHKPSRRIMELYVMHNIQSLYLPGRRKAGYMHNRRFTDEVTPRKHLVIAGMDGNDVVGGHSMKPFREDGWDPVFPFGTFRKPKARRAIDGFWTDDRDRGERILSGMPKTHKVHVDGTDHYWVRATWMVKVR